MPVIAEGKLFEGKATFLKNGKKNQLTNGQDFSRIIHTEAFKEQIQARCDE